MVDKAANAVTGAYVADAAAMGFHWLYDQERLAELAPDAPEFRVPNEADFTKGYFAHGGKNAGMPSHYGAQMKAMADSIADAPYTAANYAKQFQSAFDYGGHWVGYIDRPTRATLMAMAEASAKEQDITLCGADDAQLPALAKLPPLIAANPDSASLREDVQTAVKLTNNRADSMAWGQTYSQMLVTAIKGGNQSAIIDAGRFEATPTIQAQIEGALSMTDKTSQQVAAHFGLHCQLEVAFPVIIHAIATAQDYQSAIRANILAGGDNCGRAIPLGAVLGALFADDPDRDIPQNWIESTDLCRL